ncbi:hypothetical protein Taro_008203 [Colocasia esculenta]|uniref:Uncharacterized protein n=1 Tax=Colocasia esculenta TaxID=4460 RepID=A0A843TXK4_COLES|nr:hypothetical protein [Colocasia esculenta]
MAERRNVGGGGEGAWRGSHTEDDRKNLGKFDRDSEQWKRQLREQQYLRGLFEPGSLRQENGASRSRDSFKEVVVEAGNRVFSREVFSKVVATSHRFQKNLSRVRQGSLRHIQLSDVILVGSQDI